MTASRDDSRQGPTPHRAVPSLSLVRRRPRALWTQRYWWQWLAWPRLGGAHALAAFQFMSWLALLPPFCNSGAVAFFGGAAILLPARRSVGAVFGLAWRIPPHSDAACGRHAWASCPGAPDAQVLFGCDAACFLCGWDAQGVVLLRSPSWLGRRPPSIQSPLLAEHARSSQSPLLAETILAPPTLSCTHSTPSPHPTHTHRTPTTRTSHTHPTPTPHTQHTITCHHSPRIATPRHSTPLLATTRHEPLSFALPTTPATAPRYLQRPATSRYRMPPPANCRRAPSSTERCRRSDDGRWAREHH